ncbi:MAG TPA: response regulator [Candidatus Sulfotelmatobacter sp.]|nr:response regulator [Candidatus Sulfotelmatobacter sp.]
MKRILFVDDESKILDGLQRMLHADRKRWDMEFAVGGEAALQACEKASFDVVISDMRMPGMDGATLLGHIRDRYPSTARIILSGYSEVTLVARSVHVAHRFLAKPCDASQLRSMIERVCTLQDVLCTPEIRAVIGTVGELPSLSTSYNALTQALSRPDTSISQVADILEHDVAMSAKVLQLVNSAFFGLAQTVTSLQSAASYLGMETIKNLVLVSEAFRVFVPDSRIPQSVFEAIQLQAQRTAAIAVVLPLEPKARDVTVLSALLQDVGRLVLASKMPDKFCSVVERARERGCEPFQAEEEMLGTSHAEIGAYLLGLWGLPNLAVEAIAHHHHPDRIPHSGFDSSVALYTAALLAYELEAHPGDETGTELREFDRTCLQTLGLLPQFAGFHKLAVQAFK